MQLIQRYGGMQPGAPWGAAGATDGSGGGGGSSKWDGIGGAGGQPPSPGGGKWGGAWGGQGAPPELGPGGDVSPWRRMMGGPPPGNMGRSWGGNMVQTGGTSPPPVNPGPTLAQQAQAYMPAGMSQAAPAQQDAMSQRLLAALLTRR